MKRQRLVWNKGKVVGERIALTMNEVHAIQEELRRQEAHHDLCLFAVGIDSMLRCSDLLRLKVEDIDSQTGQINWRQRKTGRNVFPILTQTTLDAVELWVQKSGKSQRDFLFTRDKPPNSEPITPTYYRKLIKRWVQLVGLDSNQYSTHSLRRTKPSFLYHHGYSDLEHIARLLGHSNTDSTGRYLSIQQREAEAHALDGDIFATDRLEAPVGHPLLREFLKPEFLKPFAAALADQIGLKSADFIDEKPEDGR